MRSLAISSLFELTASYRGVSLYLFLTFTSTPFSSKNFTRPILSDDTAKCSSDFSLYSTLIWTSAPLSIRSLAISSFSDSTALHRAVLLFLPFSLTSTPAFIKNFTESRLPDDTARWSRDSSLYPPLIWTSAPFSMRSLAISSLFELIAS